MKKTKAFFTFLTVVAVMFSACKKEDITAFNADDAVNFTRVNNLYSTQYSFLQNPTGEYVQEIPVGIIGDTADYDRTFNVEVVQGEETTATADQYQIIGGTVKAGEFNGALSIRLLNSDALDNNTASLKLRLVDSEDFKAGNLESKEFRVSWTNQIIVPTWNVYLRTFITPTGSTLAYRLFLQISGLSQFAAAEYSALGAAGVEALGTKYGDYIMQWNKDNPDDILRHDDGAAKDQPIVPIYYTRSKFD